MDRGDKICQAVKKCKEETMMDGKMVLGKCESRMKKIAQLWIDLFLDLPLDNELDLLVDEQGKVNEHGQLSR